MPTRSQPASAVRGRRREILDAALRIFLQQGLAGATIEQIRAASGASSGSIYHHFGSKEAIAVALYLEGMESYQTALLSKLRSQRTAETGVRSLVREHLHWTAGNASLSLYLTRVATSDVAGEAAERITAVNRQLFEAVYAWLAPFIERGEVRRLQATMYTPVILGPASLFARHWLVGRMPIDLEETAATFADAAWHALAGSRATGNSGIARRRRLMRATDRENLR